MATAVGNSKQLSQTNPRRRNIIILIIVLLVILAVGFIVYRNAVQSARAEYFMDREIILVGTSGTLTALAEELRAIDPDIELTLDPERSFSLQELESPAQQTLGPQTVASAALQIGSGSPACAQLSNDLEINLYELTGSTDDVEAVLAAIDQTSAGRSVLAEANWVIGAPWSPTGSPWSPTGSPWSPTGSTNQGAPTPATMNDYVEQWAFSTIGLADAQTVNNDPALAPVRVGVFDTSPLEGIENMPENVNEQPQKNDLGVRVEHPKFVATPVPPEPGSREDITVPNHGYFGASFIRALTPGSDIQLIRVLTRNNRGDLATLNHELLTFMGEANGDSVNAVVNMSLGVPPLMPWQPFAPWLLWEFSVPFKLERQLNSLRTVMQIGECLDVVMVAASGNDSAQSLKVGNYPANWGTVLGVTASNQANEKACYANEGELAAPGGDGRSPDDPPGMCEPKLHLCSGPNCPYAVIGFVHPQAQAPNTAARTHEQWVGTSFAAPMVTGLAALLRQLEPDLSAAEVRELIHCGTVAPTTPQQVPVINVRQTLDCAAARSD